MSTRSNPEKVPLDSVWTHHAQIIIRHTARRKIIEFQRILEKKTISCETLKELSAAPALFGVFCYCLYSDA